MVTARLFELIESISLQISKEDFMKKFNAQDWNGNGVRTYFDDLFLIKLKGLFRTSE